MDIPGWPSATYRLQFNSGFTFQDARDLVPYLHRLGISHIYASPIFTARKGSTHGYDVVDPTRLNPELGTESDFLGMVGALKAQGMGLILDIVPNHMAAGLENPWWRDVLENGPTSKFASFFDIRWRESETAEASPLTLPVLGRPYEDASAAGELNLGLDEGSFHISVYGQRLPVEARSHGLILEQCLSMFTTGLDSEDQASLRRLIARTGRLSAWQTTSPRGSAGRRGAASRIKDEISRLASSSAPIKSALRRTAHSFDPDDGGKPAGALLDRLLAQQPYRLTYWKDGRRTLNYRRFFDINDLAGIKVEDPAVFEASHSLIFELAAQGRISGVRIDHIDGLKDPAAYLRRLRHRLGPNFYILVEKILAHTEQLPEAWPVHGTTGYEFMNVLNGLFVDSHGLEVLTEHFRQAVGSNESFNDVAYEKKISAAQQLFPGELNRLALALFRLSQKFDGPERPTAEQFEQALLEVTACLPVYRTYIARRRRTPEDLKWLNTALGEAVRRTPNLDPAAVDFLCRVLLTNGQDMPSGAHGALSDFISQWQQFTGPLAAKGVEDTALYVYTPLTAVNEVGSDPDNGSTSIGSFHRFCQERQVRWPVSMSATSTHDTKRSEDVRARLSALSEDPDSWRQHFQRWTNLNREKKVPVRGYPMPDAREEWLLYQTMLGAWPLNINEVTGFKNRVKEYVVKSARESKLNTSWLEPDAEHEAALCAFTDSIFSETDDNRFLSDFLEFQNRVAFWGFLNSLSQTLLKLTAPGVPDIYQGTETWDFSLVDPDNRRTVDFETRKRLLNRLESSDSSEERHLQSLVDSWQDGRVKLLVTSKTLAFRKQYPSLFSQGNYTPLLTEGARAENICAFSRNHGQDWAISVVPRLVSKFFPISEPPTNADIWGDTLLRLPGGAPKRWVDVFSGEQIRVSGPERGMRIADVFHHLPVALLRGHV